MTQANIGNSGNWTVTSKLKEFFGVVIGAQVTEEQVRRINSGELDLLVGLVEHQNCSQNDKNLEQVTLQTAEGDYFTLTNNRNLLISKSVIDLFNNTYLINRPSEIGITNLNNFRDKIQAAARYRHPIYCVYDRTNGQILWLNTISNRTSLGINNNEPENSLLATGPGHRSNRRQYQG